METIFSNKKLARTDAPLASSGTSSSDEDSASTNEDHQTTGKKCKWYNMV